MDQFTVKTIEGRMQMGYVNGVNFYVGLNSSLKAGVNSIKREILSKM